MIRTDEEILERHYDEYVNRVKEIDFKQLKDLLLNSKIFNVDMVEFSDEYGNTIPQTIMLDVVKPDGHMIGIQLGEANMTDKHSEERLLWCDFFMSAVDFHVIVKDFNE